MPDTNEMILSEIRELKSWLYGKNGFEGDIPEIKEAVKTLQDDQNCLRKKHENLNRRFWMLVGILGGSGVIGGGLLKLLG